MMTVPGFTPRPCEPASTVSGPASFDLVQLGGDDNGVKAVAHDPVVHDLVVGGGLMTDIDQQEHGFQHRGFVEGSSR